MDVTESVNEKKAAKDEELDLMACLKNVNMCIIFFGGKIFFTKCQFYLCI